MSEGIHYWKVIVVGVVALIVFGIAGSWSTHILNVRSKELQPNGPDPIPRQIGQAKIGLVEQVPFDVIRAYANYRREKLETLGTWGWIDRKAGTVHMPIDAAIDGMLQGQAR